MEVVKIIAIGFLVVLFLIQFYLIYQLERNYKVLKIRKKWYYNDNPKLKKYSFDEMLDPNKKNWFGFKYPNEKDF